MKVGLIVIDFYEDICPSELVKVGKVLQELGEENLLRSIRHVVSCTLHPEKRKAKPLKPVYVSVDPARDTISQLKHYSQDFHPSFAFLTGTKEQIEKASKAYRVYFSKV